MKTAFGRLWAADTVNQLGTSVRTAAIPLVGVTMLGATSAQMGLLVAAGTTAFLVIGLPAGAWVDRLPRRGVMVVANLVRAALLLTIPVAAWLGWLSFAQLVIVALLIGCMTVLFNVATSAMLQTVVPSDQRAKASGRVELTNAAARLGGQPTAGGLAQLIGAASTTGLSALAYLMSALLIRKLPAPEPPERKPDSSLRAEVLAGLRYTYDHPVFRPLMISAALYAFFMTLGVAVEVLFLAGQLALPPTVVGALLATGGLGQLCGSATAQPWAKRFGDVRAIVVVLCVARPFALLIPLTGTGWAVSCYAVGMFVTSYGIAVHNVLKRTLRQHLCPPELYGRMAATSQFVVWGAIPIGALVGGAIGSAAGVRPTLWIAAVGGLLPALWLVFSPLRRLRSVSELGVSDQAAVGGPAG